MILKIKDLAKTDIDNKGLNIFGFENKGFSRFLAMKDGSEKVEFEELILKTNDLANVDIDNKELSSVDIENKGVSFWFSLPKGEKGATCGCALL